MEKYNWWRRTQYAGLEDFYSQKDLKDNEKANWWANFFVKFSTILRLIVLNISKKSMNFLKKVYYLQEVFSYQFKKVFFQEIFYGNKKSKNFGIFLQIKARASALFDFLLYYVDFMLFYLAQQRIEINGSAMLNNFYLVIKNVFLLAKSFDLFEFKSVLLFHCWRPRFDFISFYSFFFTKKKFFWSNFF